MERPWQSAVPKLEENVVKLVHFPTDEEDEGMARIAWRGPSAQVGFSLSSHPLSILIFLPIQKEGFFLMKS